jgi:hypothetical protein
MYPQNGTAVQANPAAFLDALRQRFGGQLPPRLGMQVLNVQAKTVMLITSDQEHELTLDSPTWQTLMPVLQAIVQQQIPLPQLLNRVILMEAGQQGIAVVDDETAMHWLANPHAATQQAAPPPPPANHAAHTQQRWQQQQATQTYQQPAPHQAQRPQHQRAADETDNYQGELIPHDSLQAVELKDTRFDPALLYKNRRTPPGVKVVGIHIRQNGGLVITDGPDAPGAPVPSDEVAPLVHSLVKGAIEQHPGAAGVVVNVETRQVFAVSLSTLLSVVARQEVPRPDQMSRLSWMMASLPKIVHEMSEAGARHADSPHWLVRVIAGLACPFFFGLAFIAYALLKATSVDPIYGFISTTPGLTQLTQEPYVYTYPAFFAEHLGWLFGAQVSLGGVLAWMPTLTEHLALAFAATSPSWRKWFWGFVVADIFMTTFHWADVLGARNADWGTSGALLVFALVLSGIGVTFVSSSNQQQRAGAFLAFGGAFLLALVSILALDGAAKLILVGTMAMALLAGVVFALFWEVIGFSSLVLGVALVPALGTLLSALFHGTGIAGIRAYYAAQRITDGWGNEVAEQRVGLGTRQVLVDASTGRSLSPGRFTLWVIGSGVMILLGGVIVVMTGVL